MDISQFEPLTTLKIEVVENQPAGLQVSIVCLPGLENPKPGQPGKTAGQWMLIKNDLDQMICQVSTGLPAKTSPETFRIVGGNIAHWLLDNKVGQSALDIKTINSQGVENAIDLICEGLYLGAYQFKKYKKEESQPAATLFLVAGKETQSVKARLEKIQKVTYATNLTRQIIHEPPSVINPQTLSELAASTAAKYGFKCTVFDQVQLKEMKAGALLAVGQGSKTPSRLIVLEYPGQAASANQKPVVLVGKAVTFDTGGYSLKNSENIVGMKYDKSGGVTVLGTLVAAALLKLKQPIVAIIPAVENMVSDKSYLPDDILISMSGKSIEVISTDAEGRLILSDALIYAQKAYQPKALIDLATLTGGVIIALGHVRAGILSNNDSLRDALIASGETTHERLWPLPLDEDYDDLIKSHEADIKNLGGREASTIVGGIFLKQFVDDQTPWAHLDIAGTADTDKNQAYCSKGPTGFGVRLLVDYLEKL